MSILVDEDDGANEIPAELKRKYKILRTLGKGGFGVVYHGKNLADDSDVAIKVAQPNQELSEAHIRNELGVLLQLDGHNAPRVFDYVVDQSAQPFIVMEYFEAPTLADWLVERNTAISWAEFQEISAGILDAVESVHASEIVHRDIKPENFFVLSDQEIKLFDFGLSLDLKAGDRGTVDDWAGTVEYMSPEQCDGRSELGIPADIYSLGILFYEIIAGHPPFYGGEGEVREAQRSRRPRQLSSICQIDRECSAIVHRCLHKDPRRRYPSVHALRSAISRCRCCRPCVGLPNHEYQKPANFVSPAKAKTSNRSREAVGLLWFESSSNIVQIQSVIADTSGQLVHISDSRCIAAFRQEMSDNPVRAALNAARIMIDRGITDRILADIAVVGVRILADGSRRFISSLFFCDDRYPDRNHDPGIVLTGAAAELVPEMSLEAGLDDEFLRVPLDTESERVTTSRHSDHEFVGHERMMNWLFESFDRATKGCPSVTVLSGEAGYGKSEIVNHLLQRISSSSGAVLVEAIRAIEPVANVSHDIVGGLLRRLLDIPEKVPEDFGKIHIESKLGPEVAEEVHLGLGIGLGWVDQSHPAYRALEAAPGALHSSVVIAVGKTLRKLAEIRPLAFIVDDAHFADDLMLDAFEYATLMEGGARIWLTLVGRPAFTARKPNFGERAELTKKITIPALDRAESGILLRQLLLPVRAVPDQAIELLYHRTQGVPLLIVDLVRGLRQDGIIRPSDRGSNWILATEELDTIPALPAVQWLAACEIDRLSTQLAAHARLAAMLGPQFSEPELEGLVNRLEENNYPVESELDPYIGVQRLRKAGVLVKESTGELRFRHSLLREILYESVPEEVRIEIHHAAFLYYQDKRDSLRHVRLTHLAFHADRCGKKDIAVECYFELTKLARSRHAYLESERLYRQILGNLCEASEKQMLASWGLGLMKFRLGYNDDALKQLEAAKKIAQTIGHIDEEAAILLDASMVLDWLDEYATSQSYVEAADKLLGNPRSDLMKVRLLLGYGRSAFRFSRIEQACQLTLDAADLAEHLGDDGYETFVISLLIAGAGLGMAGKTDEARAVFERLLAAAEQHGDKLHLASALQNRVFLWLTARDIPALLEDMHKVIELAREMGATVLEGRSVYNLGEITYLLGDFAEAEKHATRSFELNSSLSGPGGRTVPSLLLSARILVAQGKWEAARKLLMEIRKYQELARSQGRQDAEFIPSDDVLFQLVDLTTRDASDEEWDSLMARSELDSVQQERIEVREFFGISRMRMGKVDEARKNWLQAIELGTEIPNIMEDRIRERISESQKVVKAV